MTLYEQSVSPMVELTLVETASPCPCPFGLCPFVHHIIEIACSSALQLLLVNTAVV